MGARDQARPPCLLKRRAAGHAPASEGPDPSVTCPLVSSMLPCPGGRGTAPIHAPQHRELLTVAVPGHGPRHQLPVSVPLLVARGPRVAAPATGATPPSRVASPVAGACAARRVQEPPVAPPRPTTRHGVTARGTALAPVLAKTVRRRARVSTRCFLRERRNTPHTQRPQVGVVVARTHAWAHPRARAAAPRVTTPVLMKQRAEPTATVPRP